MIKERCWVYRNWAVTEVEWATRSIYSGDPGVDRHHLIFIASCHTMNIHTLSFPTFGLPRSFFPDCIDSRNCVDPHSRVVSYLHTFFQHSLSQNRTPSRIRFGCCERSGAMLMVGSLPSISVVSPQRPSSGASLCPLNAHLWLCSTTICG